MNLQLEKDAQHYVQLWDESKKNYMDYKEETQAIVVQRDDLLNEIRQKEAEAQQLHEAVNNARQQAQSSMEKSFVKSKTSVKNWKTVSSTCRWKTFS